MATTNFETYAELWKRAERIGAKEGAARRAIYVHEMRSQDGASSFNPEWSNGPALQINNLDRTRPTAKPVDDARVMIKLISLAHEMGHATSWSTNADGAWAEYFAAIKHRYEVTMRTVATLGPDASLEARERAAIAAVCAELTHRERELIWREENRAWEIGEALLRGTAFDDWPSFVERRQRALRSYEVRLGRAEPAPGELALLPVDLE